MKSLASSKFHRTSFQNKRFVRGFLEISKNKPPKRTFRARLPPNFTEQASKTNVSREASSKFHRTKLPKQAFRARLPPNFIDFTEQSFQNERFVRGFLEISQNKLPKRAFRARLPPNFIEQSFQNERFAWCFRQLPYKLCVSPQFHAINPPNPTRGFIQQKQNVRIATTACHPKFQNTRFTTAACAKMYEFTARRPGQPTAYKNQHFTTVSDIWPARSDERVARASSKFVFHHIWTSDEHETTRWLREDPGRFAFHLSFGRPTSTKWREGCDDDVQTSHFTSVLDVRRPRSDERVARRSQKFAFHHSFGRPTSTKWREGGLPSWSTKPTLRKKKKEILKKSWSSRFSQHIFAADLLSRFSQQIFSADLLSRSSQPFAANFLSRSSQQIFSADFLGRFSQQIFSLSYHHLFAVVRGWWSAIVLSFLSFAVVKGWWSAIVLSFAVVRGWWSAIVLSFAVVRGWWSAIVLSCWWSILHEFFRRTLSRSFRE